MVKDEKTQEMITKVRAAIKDRAVWFALLYKAFKETLPEAKVEELCRKAIFEFGKMKGKKDKLPFDFKEWVNKHEEKGSALVFDSDIEICEDHSIQRMKHCALVEAWKEMGLSDEEVAKFCDIAMEGDRGRAEYHGVKMELKETLGKGDKFCKLVISKK